MEHKTPQYIPRHKYTMYANVQYIIRYIWMYYVNVGDIDNIFSFLCYAYIYLCDTQVSSLEYSPFINIKFNMGYKAGHEKLFRLRFSCRVKAFIFVLYALILYSHSVFLVSFLCVCVLAFRLKENISIKSFSSLTVNCLRT